MKDFKILYVGWLFFGLSFFLGTICLFGYILTKDVQYAVAGMFVLIYGAVVNAIVFLILICVGLFFSKKSHEYFDAALLILCNIPIAMVYLCIGGVTFICLK